MVSLYAQNRSTTVRTNRTGKETPNIQRMVKSGYRDARGRVSSLLYSKFLRPNPTPNVIQPASERSRKAVDTYTPQLSVKMEIHALTCFSRIG